MYRTNARRFWGGKPHHATERPPRPRMPARSVPPPQAARTHPASSQPFGDERTRTRPRFFRPRRQVRPPRVPLVVGRGQLRCWRRHPVGADVLLTRQRRPEPAACWPFTWCINPARVGLRMLLSRLWSCAMFRQGGRETFTKVSVQHVSLPSPATTQQSMVDGVYPFPPRPPPGTPSGALCGCPP